jgi:hypothetical protein
MSERRASEVSRYRRPRLEVPGLLFEDCSPRGWLQVTYLFDVHFTRIHSVTDPIVQKPDLVSSSERLRKGEPGRLIQVSHKLGINKEYVL